MKDKSVIPKGIYCYDENGKACPYWSMVGPHCGHCAYIDMSDEDFYDGGGRHARLSLLWDQCKECDENMEELTDSKENKEDYIKALEADVDRYYRVLSEINDWTSRYGKSLIPGFRSDTFGEGMREAKEQVKSILGQLDNKKTMEK